MRSLFDVVGLLGGRSLVREIKDILGDRFLIEIRGDSCLISLAC